MLTPVDKALVALVMFFLGLANAKFGWDTSLIDQDTVTVLIGALTPLFVYLVPNKAA